VRIGIVADIHEAVEPLARALAEFRRRGVDQVVNLGDACDTLSLGKTGEVVALLRDCGAVGVWGNHDFGACYDVPDEVRRRTPPDVLEYLATMQPHLVLGGCRFTHNETWLDPHKMEDLWYYEGLPDTPEKAARSFAAAPERRLFIGHLHQWLAMTPAGRVDWNGERPLTLELGQRYLIAIAAVLDGWCALYDSASTVFTPIRCAE
jgi:hypothetical protein